MDNKRILIFIIITVIISVASSVSICMFLMDKEGILIEKKSIQTNTSNYNNATNSEKAESVTDNEEVIDSNDSEDDFSESVNNIKSEDIPVNIGKDTPDV